MERSNIKMLCCRLKGRHACHSFGNGIGNIQFTQSYKTLQASLQQANLLIKFVCVTDCCTSQIWEQSLGCREAQATQILKEKQRQIQAEHLRDKTGHPAIPV